MAATSSSNQTAPSTLDASVYEFLEKPAPEPTASSSATMSTPAQSSNAKIGPEDIQKLSKEISEQIGAQIDLSASPISALLKEGTTRAHEEAENSEGAVLLVKGALSKREYTRVLFMLWHIYDALERGLFEHRDHPLILNIYHPRVFSRASTISFDICHFLETVTWQTDPFYVEFFNSMPPAVAKYIDYLDYIGREGASEAEAALLASHAYVRYLGDLSGGQTIKRRIVKAYDLYDDGDGIAFYTFRHLDPNKGDWPADNAEMKKIKEWFKQGLDDGVADNVALKAALIREANAAFKYNEDVFHAIDKTQLLPPKDPKAKSSVLSERAKEAGVSLSALIAVILAISLAHFGLTMLGISGTKGVQQVIDRFLGA